jgi:hypothetical protein
VKPARCESCSNFTAPSKAARPRASSDATAEPIATITRKPMIRGMAAIKHRQCSSQRGKNSIAKISDLRAHNDS